MRIDFKRKLHHTQPMRKPAKYRITVILCALAVIALFSVPPLCAEVSAFRTQFIENYKQNLFREQAALVRENKTYLPDEVNSILKDARAEKDLKKRLYLLEIASAMATMHVYWNNGSSKLIQKVEKMQSWTLKKLKKSERERITIEEAEHTTGNFVLRRHEEEVRSEGLSPVIYPHWVHRAFYRCTVCHTSIFEMKRGANDLTHSSFDQGAQCGLCHNGEVSFATNDKKVCIRCHVFDKTESRPLIDLTYYDDDRFSEIAARVGSSWDPEKLPYGKLPRDMFNFIDWVRLDESGAAKQITSIDDGATSTDDKGGKGTDGSRETRDTLILFEIKSTYLKDVLFSHKIHTTWVDCALCHPGIFTKELGSNEFTRMDIQEGRACGTCHGRVSFSAKDCDRCHTQEKGEPKCILGRPEAGIR